jgi:hypothetical protein
MLSKPLTYISVTWIEMSNINASEIPSQIKKNCDHLYCNCEGINEGEVHIVAHCTVMEM